MVAGAATMAIPSLTEVSLGAVRASARPAENTGNVAGPIRLSRNENAYGPSARITSAMQEAAVNTANRYPDTEAEALRIKIAAFHHVAPEQVVLGCGSREIMRTAVDAFAGRGKKLVLAQPTFDLMARFAENAGVEAIAVPLTTPAEVSVKFCALLEKPKAVCTWVRTVWKTPPLRKVKR